MNLVATPESPNNNIIEDSTEPPVISDKSYAESRGKLLPTQTTEVPSMDKVNVFRLPRLELKGLERQKREMMVGRRLERLKTEKRDMNSVIGYEDVTEYCKVEEKISSSDDEATLETNHLQNFEDAAEIRSRMTFTQKLSRKKFELKLKQEGFSNASQLLEVIENTGFATVSNKNKEDIYIKNFNYSRIDLDFIKQLQKKGIDPQILFTRLSMLDCPSYLLHDFDEGTLDSLIQIGVLDEKTFSSNYQKIKSYNFLRISEQPSNQDTINALIGLLSEQTLPIETSNKLEIAQKIHKSTYQRVPLNGLLKTSIEDLELLGQLSNRSTYSWNSNAYINSKELVALFKEKGLAEDLAIFLKYKHNPTSYKFDISNLTKVSEEEREDTFQYIKKFSNFMSDPDKRLWLSVFQSVDTHSGDNRINEFAIDRAEETFKYKHILETYFALPGHERSLGNTSFMSELIRELDSLVLSDPDKASELLSFKPDEYYILYLNSIFKLGGLSVQKYEEMRGNKPEKYILEDVQGIIRSYQVIEQESEENKLQLILDLEDLDGKYLSHSNTNAIQRDEDNITNKLKLAKKFSSVSPDIRQFILDTLPTSLSDFEEKSATYANFFQNLGLGDFNVINFLINSKSGKELESMARSFQFLLKNEQLLNLRIGLLNIEYNRNIGFYNSELETLRWVTELEENEFLNLSKEFQKYNYRNINTLSNFALYHQNRENVEVLIDKINKFEHGEDSSKYIDFEGFSADLWKISSVMEIINNGNIDTVLDIALEITDTESMISIDHLAYLSSIASSDNFNVEKYKETIRSIQELFNVTSKSDFRFLSKEEFSSIYEISLLDDEAKINWTSFINGFKSLDQNDFDLRDKLSAYWSLFNNENREEIENFLKSYNEEVINFNFRDFLSFLNGLGKDDLKKVLQLQDLNGNIGNGSIELKNLSHSTLNDLSVEGLILINSVISPQLQMKLSNIPGNIYLDQIARFTTDPQSYIQYSIPLINRFAENDIVVNLNIDPNDLKDIEPSTINSLIDTMSTLNRSTLFKNKVFSRDYKDYLKLNEFFTKNDISLENFNNVISSLQQGDINSTQELMMYFQNVYPMDLEYYNQFITTIKEYCPSYVQPSNNRYALETKASFVQNIDFLKRNKSILNPSIKFDIASFETLNKLVNMEFDDNQLVNIINNSVIKFPLSTFGDVIDILPTKDASQVQFLIETINNRLFEHYGESPTSLSSIITELYKLKSSNAEGEITEQITGIVDLLSEFPINLNVLGSNTYAVIDLVKSSPSNLRFILEQSSGSSGLININTLQQFVKAEVLDINSVEDQQTYRRFVNEIGYFPSKKIFALYRNFDQNKDFTTSLEYLENIDDLAGVETKNDFTERIKVLRTNLLKTGNVDPKSSLQKDILMIEGRFELGRFKRNQGPEGLEAMVTQYYYDLEENKIAELQSVFTEGEIEVDVVKNFKISEDSIGMIESMLGNTKESMRILNMNGNEIIEYTLSELSQYVQHEMKKLQTLEENSTIEHLEELSVIEEAFKSLDLNNIEGTSNLLKSIGFDDNQTKILQYLLQTEKPSIEQLQSVDKTFEDKSILNRTIAQLKKNNLITYTENGDLVTNIDLIQNYAINKVNNKNKNIEKQLNNKKEMYRSLITTMNDLNTILKENGDLSKICEIAGLSSEFRSSNPEEQVIMAMLSLLSNYKEQASKNKINTNNLNDLTQRLIWAYVLKNPHLLNLSHELGTELTSLASTEIGLRHLNTFSELVNEHIGAHAIESMPLSKNQKEQLRKSFNINPLIQDLNNFNASEATNKNTYSILPTRGVLAELSGDMGDACWASRSSNIMRDNPNMTAFTIVENYSDPLSAKSVGSFLVIRETINGQPALILRGINPRQDIFDQGVTGNSFLAETLKYLEIIANNIKMQEGARNVIIVAPRSESGAFSNREALNSAHQNYFSGSDYHLDHINTFNSYNITQNISIRNGDTVLSEETVAEETVIDGSNLYVPLLSLN